MWTLPKLHDGGVRDTAHVGNAEISKAAKGPWPPQFFPRRQLVVSCRCLPLHLQLSSLTICNNANPSALVGSLRFSKQGSMMLTCLPSTDFRWNGQTVAVKRFFLKSFLTKNAQRGFEKEASASHALQVTSFISICHEEVSAPISCEHFGILHRFSKSRRDFGIHGGRNFVPGGFLFGDTWTCKCRRCTMMKLN